MWHLRSFVGLGAIFTALSELWFYPISDLGDLFGLVIFYAIAAHVSVLAVFAAGGGGAFGFYLAAVILGLLVEGVPVFELYSALPFTLVWTSMAWHGVVSGLVGVWLYRFCASKGAAWFVLANVVFGSALGLWAAYFWSQEPEGLRFAEQMPWAFLLFALGHIVLPDASVPKAGLRWVLIGFALLVALAYAGAALWLVFPFSLVLPASIAVSVYAARGAASQDDLWPRSPLRRAWAMLFMPVAAVLTYDFSVAQVWVAELNAYAILVLGPVSVGLLLWALVGAIKKGRGNRAPSTLT